jgi:predicted MFS family arabinose efflux permease
MENIIIKLKRNRILVYAFLQLFIFVISRTLIGPLIPVISAEFGIGLDQMGSAIALSVFALFFASITTGSLIEFIGLRNVLVSAIFINAAGSLIMFFSQYFALFMTAFFLLEFSFGVIYVSNLSIVGIYYNKKRASNLLKVNQGQIIAFILSPLIVSLLVSIGKVWRYYYLFNLLILLALFVFLMKIDVPREKKSSMTLDKLFKDNKKILTNPAFLLVAIIIFFYEPVMETFYVWFTSYFESIDVNIDISSLFLTLYGISLFTGMLLKNHLIKYFAEKKILLSSFAAGFVLLAGILFIDNLVIKNILIFLFGIAVVGNFTISFSVASGFLPKYNNAVSGLTFAFSNIGIIVFHYITGYMSEYLTKSSVLFVNITLLFVLIILTSFLNYHWKFKKDK